MYQCEYCGSSLPDYAHFCGNCGQVSSDPSKWPTRVSGLPAVNFDTRDAATALSASSIPPSLRNVDQVQENSVLSIPDLVTISLNEESEDDEEQKRRAAMIGFGLPFLGNQSLAGHVPMVQGTPQPAQVPFVQGTPHVLQGPVSVARHVQEAPHSGAATHSTLSAQPPISPHISHPTTPLHLPRSSSHPGHSHHQHHSTDPHHPHHHKKHGHAKHWVIAAIITPIIIIVTIIGTGFTVWTPILSLSGGTDVVQGGTLHLHGSNFLPGSNVTLTLDGAAPLYFTRRHLPIQIQALHAVRSIGALAMFPVHEELSFSSSNLITVTGNGTFNALIPIDLSWHLGRHTIRAAESITQRSAELTFTIYLPGILPTPASSGTATLSPTAPPKSSQSPTKLPTGSPFPKESPTPTPTKPSTGSPTPTGTLAGLSCVNPSSVTLGPVSEGYNQPVSVTVTLCTKGSGTVSWNATWDMNSASWLQLDRSSGQIQAPGQEQINVSALATQLKQGNYNATVTFRSQPSNSTVMLNVTFIVQAPPTLSVSPGSIYANQQCSSSPASAWVCYVSLTNNSNSLSLSWSASSTGVPGITFKPSNDAIAPGQTERVEVIVPYNDCQTSTTLIFTGPANTVNVPWTCTLIG